MARKILREGPTFIKKSCWWYDTRSTLAHDMVRPRPTMNTATWKFLQAPNKIRRCCWSRSTLAHMTVLYPRDPGHSTPPSSLIPISATLHHTPRHLPIFCNPFPAPLFRSPFHHRLEQWPGLWVSWRLLCWQWLPRAGAWNECERLRVVSAGGALLFPKPTAGQ